MFRMDLKARISERLSATNQTARGASLKAGLGADAIRIILTGRSISPRAENLSALAGALNCDIRYLLGEVEEPGPSSEPDQAPGARLRQVRRDAGLSAEDLARFAGCSPSAIRNQENGTNGIPAAMARKYAERLGVAPEWILFGTGDMAPSRAAVMTLTQLAGGNARLELNTVLPMPIAIQILELIEGDKTSSP